MPSTGDVFGMFPNPRAVFQDSRFIDFCRNVIGWQGNTPGWPNQFEYESKGKFGPGVQLQTVPENLDVFPEPLAQIPRENRLSNDAHLYGNNVMVADVPFDWITLAKTNRNLGLAGFALVIVGGALVFL